MNISKMIKEIVNKVPLEYEKCLGYDRKCESILVSIDFSSDHSVSKKEQWTCLNF